MSRDGLQAKCFVVAVDADGNMMMMVGDRITREGKWAMMEVADKPRFTWMKHHYLSFSSANAFVEMRNARRCPLTRRTSKHRICHVFSLQHAGCQRLMTKETFDRLPSFSSTIDVMRKQALNFSPIALRKGSEHEFSLSLESRFEFRVVKSWELNWSPSNVPLDGLTLRPNEWNRSPFHHRSAGVKLIKHLHTFDWEIFFWRIPRSAKKRRKTKRDRLKIAEKLKKNCLINFLFSSRKKSF